MSHDLLKTVRGVQIPDDLLPDLSDAGSIPGDLGCKGALQGHGQGVEANRDCGKEADREKSFQRIQHRFLEIAPPTGILNTAVKNGHDQTDGKECPPKLGKELYDSLYPGHLKQLNAHITHLREEVSEEAHDLPIEPVHQVIHDGGRYKVPNKHRAIPPALSDYMPMMPQMNCGAVSVRIRQTKRIAIGVRSNWPCLRYSR